MSTYTVARVNTLPDSSDKSDFHGLVETATVTISSIAATDLAGSIPDSKLNQLTTANKVSITAMGARATFVDGDLSSSKLTVTHNKGLAAPYTCIVYVVDNNGKMIIPDEITFATNSFEIDLTSFSTLSGTWGYAYIG